MIKRVKFFNEILCEWKNSKQKEDNLVLFVQLPQNLY